ncbi:MAG: DUF4389 domain-containing protein [Actinomycetota bacterium]|nr:DUF4389 domain-containing protein [Actinomycetota bacterium]
MNEMTIDSHEPYLIVDSPYAVARWRPLVNWVLFIPHCIILYGLQALSRAVFLVYWVMFLFTGKLHPGLYNVMVMYERYNARTGGFLVGFSEVYPPFDFALDTADNNAYPAVRLTLPVVPESAPRSAALNLLKAIPHYLVLMIYLIGAAAVALVGWFAVLFTGAWPHGMRRFLVRVSNYQYRIWVYVTMVDNTYPKFGLRAA